MYEETRREPQPPVTERDKRTEGESKCTAARSPSSKYTCSEKGSYGRKWQHTEAVAQASTPVLSAEPPTTEHKKGNRKRANEQDKKTAVMNC